MPNDIMERFEQRVKAVLATRGHHREEVVYPTAQGPRHVEYVVSPLDMGEERDKLVLNVVRDVTERKQAEEAQQKSERFLRATLDSLSSHVAILDETGTIVTVNEAWRTFARANGVDPSLVCEGANYIRVSGKHNSFARVGERTARAMSFRSASTMSDTPLVHVADDDGYIRESFRCLLESDGLLGQIHHSAHEFLQSYRHMSVNCRGTDLTIVRCVEVANLICTVKGYPSVGLKLIKASQPALNALSLTKEHIIVLANDLDEELAKHAALFEL